MLPCPCFFRLRINWGVSIVLCTVVMPISGFIFLNTYCSWISQFGIIFMLFWREPQYAGSRNRSYWIYFAFLILDKGEYTWLGTFRNIQVHSNLRCSSNYLWPADHNQPSCVPHIYPYGHGSKYNSINRCHICYIWKPGNILKISISLVVGKSECIFWSFSCMDYWFICLFLTVQEQLLLNCGFFVFLLHILFAVFLTKLGMKTSLTLPHWLESAI